MCLISDAGIMYLLSGLTRVRFKDVYTRYASVE